MYSNNLNFPTSDDYFVKAHMIHKTGSVTDSHFDLPAIISNYNAHRIYDVTERFFLRDWLEGGFNLIGCSIYISNAALNSGSAYDIAFEQIEALKRDIEPLMPHVQIIYNKHQLDDVLKNNYTGLLLYFEGMEPIEHDINCLNEFYKAGIRGASLTWSRGNALATGCCKAGQYENRTGHLSELGIAAIKAMEKKNMFLDISHLNDDGISDIEKLTYRPYLATHSNCRSLCDNYRNLTDHQILNLTNKKGMIGINAYKYLNLSKYHPLASEMPPGNYNRTDNNFLNAMAGQIMYLYNQKMASNITYGFDLCDMLTASEHGSLQKISCDDTIPSHRHAVLLTARLLQNCIPEAEVIKIIGGNFTEYVKQYLPDM